MSPRGQVMAALGILGETSSRPSRCDGPSWFCRSVTGHQSAAPSAIRPRSCRTRRESCAVVSAKSPLTTFAGSQRADVYKRARQQQPRGWSRSTRCWHQPEVVWINPAPPEIDAIPAKLALTT